MEVNLFRSWVEISRARLAANYRSVRQAVGPGVEIAAVVKAEAYGHGAAEVSRVLAAEGATWLAVSSADEGVALRDAGLTQRILVMADSLPYSYPALVGHSLTPAVHSLDDLRALDALAASRNTKLRVHLKLDTGMGRLGTTAAPADIAAAVGCCPHVEIEGLMSHFASAADYTSDQSARQSAEFTRIATELCGAGIRPAYLHMASTNPVAYGRRDSWHNMVRPGHAIYGYISPVRGQAPARLLQVAPALTWKARVIAVKDLAAGSLIGYGGMFRATRPTRIAVLAVGYADGLAHRLSNRGYVIAGGKAAPIIGAVSMDVTTIDVTDCPPIRPGDAVTLLGEEGGISINAQQLGRMAGTISYDVLCGIRTRVKRIYVD